MNEAEVLKNVHRFLQDCNLWNQPVVRLYTDAHSTLVNHQKLAPFQRFTLELGDRRYHPDLVGQLGDGETIFAVEAKGESDLLKGIAQAKIYQTGFHSSFLAADAQALGTSLLDFAHRQNIGVLAVSNQVEVLHLPGIQMPLRDPYRFIARQLESIGQVSGSQTFSFNLPTHYLAWAIAMKPRLLYTRQELPALLTGYPMPKDWNRALAGAQKLGLVAIHGNQVRLTPVGATVQELLPGTLMEWAKIHRTVGARGRGKPLVQEHPPSAIALRLMLLHDPMVQLVTAGLETFSSRSASFAQLAVACDQIDHARAPIFFLKPSSAVTLTDKTGRVHWEQAQGSDYRSTMFYQYKSILKHSGILENTKLGHASSKDYQPNEDLWVLR